VAIASPLHGPSAADGPSDRRGPVAGGWVPGGFGQDDEAGPAGPAPFVMGAGLPVLRDRQVTLRALRSSDAATLLVHVSSPEVLRHIAPAPTTIAGFTRFVRWTHAQRRRRLHAAFGIIPAGASKPVGIVQCWPIELDWSIAEWGFVLGRQHWGTGLFERAARLMLDFAFDTAGVSRMEARAADLNGRGNGALRKLGAFREGTLRGACRLDDQPGDHVMWSILAEEWRARTRQQR
jgi:ribosomal-protein-alanine N-acetyltransferase